MAHVVRVSKLDLATVLSQPNPQIDLRIESYESSTRDFLSAVSNYTQRGVAEITQRKNNFVNNKNKILDKTKQIENETNNCKVKELELMAVLERETEERKEAELSVAAFRRQLSALKEKCATIDVEIEQHKAKLQNLQREHHRETSLLNSHAARVSPELAECEERLQCVIEGIDRDKILVRFTHIDRSDTSREFSMVIDVSDRTYQVPTTSPVLPTLPIFLEELNESRDIFHFIKQARQAFEHLVTQGRTIKSPKPCIILLSVDASLVPTSGAPAQKTSGMASSPSIIATAPFASSMLETTPTLSMVASINSILPTVHSAIFLSTKKRDPDGSIKHKFGTDLVLIEAAAKSLVVKHGHEGVEMEDAGGSWHHWARSRG
ncbi:hypothetical protein NLI96_g4766 [Meripilus lineatus]|uniref:Kinetochore protein SPC25 n=1 Tax=Meripilus lineatus TaxID=2056292 RepID=A0AAD5V443_9APHY|nr:hypothetical protein NLI96_g4766 [Physisporinus lineatus]